MCFSIMLAISMLLPDSTEEWRNSLHAVWPISGIKSDEYLAITHDPCPMTAKHERWHAHNGILEEVSQQKVLCVDAVFLRLIAYIRIQIKPKWLVCVTSLAPHWWQTHEVPMFICSTFQSHYIHLSITQTKNLRSEPFCIITILRRYSQLFRQG